LSSSRRGSLSFLGFSNGLGGFNKLKKKKKTNSLAELKSRDLSLLLLSYYHWIGFSFAICKYVFFFLNRFSWQMIGGVLL
jgi:hypothetical protein